MRDICLINQMRRQLIGTNSLPNSGIKITGSTIATIDNCTFTNLTSLSGVIQAKGPISIQQENTASSMASLTVSNSIFISNTAAGTDGGAGINCDNMPNVVLSNNKFDSNYASIADGGGVKLTCSNSLCNYTLNSNEFTQNHAATNIIENITNLL